MFPNLLLQNLFGEPVGCCEILRSAGGANPSGNDSVVVIKMRFCFINHLTRLVPQSVGFF